MPPAPSADRALAAILPLVSSGHPYEAHQKARTFASRYVKAGQYAVAIDVLFQSAREMLKAGEPGSGTDLAGFLLDVYESKGEEVNAESRGRLTQLIALTGPQGAWRKTTIDKTIVWSAKHGPCPAGDPDLHHYIGELLYKEGAYLAAEPHLLSAGKRDSARILAEMFSKWSTSTSTPPGLFAIRAVIPYLQNGNILAARSFLTHFLPSFSSVFKAEPIPVGTSTNESSITPTSDSLLNFAQLIVVTCQRANGDNNRVVKETWVRLCGNYQARGGPNGPLALPDVRLALQEVGELFFALPPPRQTNANPLGEMLSSMLGGGSSAPQPRRQLVAPGAVSAPALD